MTLYDTITDIPFNFLNKLNELALPVIELINKIEDRFQHESVGHTSVHEKGKVYKDAREWTTRDSGAYTSKEDKRMVWIWSINFRPQVIKSICVGYRIGKKGWVKRSNGL